MLAALGIQEEAKRLANEVQRRDGVALRLRVGLNSGRVIAGALGGSGAPRYAAIGEPVGFAQRRHAGCWRSAGATAWSVAAGRAAATAYAAGPGYR